MQARKTAFLIALVAVAGAMACEEVTAIDAQFDNREQFINVFALNGTTSAVPTGVLVRATSATRVDANFAFDLAFDFAGPGQITVLTAKSVATEFVPARRVGLLLATQPFGAINDAPTGGYKYDSTLVVSAHQAFYVDVIEPTCSTLSILGPNIRAKVVIDSAFIADKSIFLHIISNPNCGFHSLVYPGKPKE